MLRTEKKQILGHCFDFFHLLKFAKIWQYIAWMIIKILVYDRYESHEAYSLILNILTVSKAIWYIHDIMCLIHKIGI